MFGLIPMVLTIILAGLAVLSIVFFGGDALTQGSDDAKARKVINQGEQISAAIDLYKAVNGELPQSGGVSDLSVILDNSNDYYSGSSDGWAFANDGASVQVEGGAQCDAVNQSLGYSGATPDCSTIPPALADKKYYCCTTP